MTGRPRVAALSLTLLATALLGEPVLAQPRSAIPWLSQSIILTAAPPRPRSPANGALVGPEPEAITVTPLTEISRDAVGILSPEETGFDRDLWGPATAEQVRTAVLSQGGQGVPGAIALFRHLLLAEASPPVGSDPGSSVLVARIDRLLEMGALDEADAMIQTAGPDSPELFRRWFDAGLLLDRAQPPCEALRLNPALSPTLPARVFCLARGGDWNAAEITLTLGKGVGSITPDQELLLARFLDPVLFEEDEDPAIPDPLTPLDFLLREAVGLPRPPGTLPLAFLRGDIGEHVPMRTRIEAAERLTLSGALAYPEMFDAYRAGTPAASGGVWDRAQAVQTFDAALAAPATHGPKTIGAALTTLDNALAARGLRGALASEYAPTLRKLTPDTLPAPARRTLVELLLLGGDIDAARAAAGPAPEPRLATLLAIASNETAPATEDAMLRAALDGLAQRPPSDDTEQRLAALVAAGRQGEALLAALDLISQGAASSPPALRAALFGLHAAGQESAARDIALETLLSQPPA